VQKLGVCFDDFVDLLVQGFGPPDELRIVEHVEVVPVVECAAQLLQAVGSAVERSGVRFGAAQVVCGGGDVMHQFFQRDGRFLTVDSLHPAASLLQPDNGLLERNHQGEFGFFLGLHLQLPPLFHQAAAEQKVVDLAGLAQTVEADLIEQPQLAGVELLDL
jgi:hypothetical protein